MFLDYILLSLKNIKKRGIRSWLTMLGIFIGIAAVVSLISLGNGLQEAITGQFSSLGADRLLVTNAETGFGPPGSTAVKKLNDHDKKLIEKVSGVETVVGRLIRIVSVEYNDQIEYKYITNIPNKIKEANLIYETLNLEIESGRILNLDDRKKVVLGQDFTDNSFEKAIKIGSKLTIQGEEFEVVGILKKASTFTINSVVFMPEEDLKRILNLGDESDVIAVKIISKDVANQVAESIRARLRKDRNVKVGEEDFSVQTPEQSLQSINTILGIINLVVAGIAAISLLVGGIGITNTMYTAVLERTKEIGVMKAVGAKNQDVLFIFLIESALLGLVGGIVGSLIGLSLAFTASFLVTSAFPGLNFEVFVSFPLLFLAISFSLLVGTISGIVPALQASKLRPVEALRQ